MSRGGLASSVGAAMLAAILAGCASSPPPLTTSELVAGMGRPPDVVQTNSDGSTSYTYVYNRKGWHVEQTAIFDSDGVCQHQTVSESATGLSIVPGQMVLSPPASATAQFDAVAKNCPE